MLIEIAHEVVMFVLGFNIQEFGLTDTLIIDSPASKEKQIGILFLFQFSHFIYRTSVFQAVNSDSHIALSCRTYQQ